MSFKVDYYDFDAVTGIINSQASSWNEKIEALSNAIDNFCSSNDIEGKGAESVKYYMTNIYKYRIIPLLSNVIYLHVNNYYKYFHSFKSDVDWNDNTIIFEDLVREKQGYLNNNSAKEQDIDTEVQSVISRVSDLVSLPRPNLEDVYKYHNLINKDIIDPLIENVYTTDQTHFSTAFVDTYNSIEQINALIEELLSKSRSFIENCGAASLIEISSLKGFDQAIYSVNDYIDANKEDFEIAANTMEEHFEVLEEQRKEREERAKWIKWGIGIACAVITIATAGTGGIAVAAIVGGLTGAASAASCTAIDQHTASGRMDKFDYKEIAIDAAVGGATGALTGALGAGMKGVSSGIETSGLLMDFGKELCLGAVEETAGGVGERFFSSVGEGVKTGNYDFSSVLDIKEIGKDAAKGGFEGVVGEGFDKAMGKGSYKQLNSSNDNVRHSANFIRGGVEEGVTGVAERYVGARMDGKTHEEAAKEALDRDEVVRDTLKGGISEAAKSDNRREIQSDEYKSSTLREELENNEGAPNYKEFRANGGKIYKDSKGNTTYVYPNDKNEKNEIYKDYKGSKTKTYDRDGNLISTKDNPINYIRYGNFNYTA